jgi:hypothetical protein
MMESALRWLLDGDPAIRWQAVRDLKGGAERTVLREQRRVGAAGWGARLLALQDADGRWASGVYTPKWTSTTYTLLLLRACGLPAGHPPALRACRVLFDAGFWADGGINFYPKRAGRSETCISSMVLALAGWFRFDDPRVDRLAEHVVGLQMADGGWNCRATPGPGGATHGSFHTTISALEGLLEYQRFRPEKARLTEEAQARGREFLLVHRLFRSHRTGAVVKAAMTRLAFPPQWHYDILRGLDYFRASGAARDDRLSDALQLLEGKRTAGGLWLLENTYPGKTFFAMEARGAPSRWNTLRALRVLRWADGGPSAIPKPPSTRSARGWSP